MDNDIDLRLIQAALNGEETATKIYCGSYSLVEGRDGEYFRCKGDIPEGYLKIAELNMKSVYDKDGFLLPEYWSLPRVGG